MFYPWKETPEGSVIVQCGRISYVTELARYADINDISSYDENAVVQMG